MDDLIAKIKETAIDVLDMARRKNLTLGCAESCTGGLIASSLTAISGSSDSFVGGVVSYWVDVKEHVLGVDASIIEEEGVVSEACALAMAQGARHCLKCDYAVSTTGIAGPTGAEPGKPVGTVCFGIAGPDFELAFTLIEPGDRNEVRLRACLDALEALKENL